MSEQQPHGQQQVAKTNVGRSPQQRQTRNAVVPRMETNPILMPDDQWKRLESLADRAVKSGVLPKGIDSPQKAFIVALKGVAMGFDPLYALEHISVINGKATIDGQAMLRLAYERCPGIRIDFRTAIEKQAEECEVSVQRPGHGVVSARWTMDDAKRAGLLGNTSWQKYPRAMLRWRAIAECLRIAVPDVLAGLYLHEEMGAAVNDHGEVIEAQFRREEESKPLPAPGTPAPAVPTPSVPESDGVYRIKLAKSQYFGKTFAEVGASALAIYELEMRKHYDGKGETYPEAIADFVSRAQAWLAAQAAEEFDALETKHSEQEGGAP